MCFQAIGYNSVLLKLYIFLSSLRIQVQLFIYLSLAILLKEYITNKV